jgi:hypothetical protein
VRLRAGIPTTLVLLALILPLVPVVSVDASPEGATGRAGVGVVPVPAGADGLVTRVFTLRYKSVDDAYLLV